MQRDLLKIDKIKYTNLGTGDISYGFLLYDEFGYQHVDNWPKEPVEEGLDALELVLISCDIRDDMEMLWRTWIDEVTMSIVGVRYDYSQYSPLCEKYFNNRSKKRRKTHATSKK